VYRSFARLTADPAEAEDLTREVFVRALCALPHFEDRGLPYTAYLLRIAGNLARDQWRAGPARPVVTGDIPDLAAPGPGPDSPVIVGSCCWPRSTSSRPATASQFDSGQARVLISDLP
jgi:DNA-directed RNA polymerase specialized sigma24 family protein